MIMFIFFLLILPVFNKAIDFQESIIFFGLPLLFFSTQTKLHLKPRVIFIQLIFLALFATSCFLSINPGISYYAFFTFFTCLLIFNFASLQISSSKLFLWLTRFGFVFSLVFLLNHFSLLPLPLKPAADNFFRQIWGHSYSADFILLSLVTLLTQFPLTRLNLFNSLLQIMALVLTNSRSAWLSLLITILFVPLKKFNSLKYLGVVTLLAAAIIYSLKIPENSSVKSPSGSRLEYFSQATKAFLAHPFFGNGPGTFPLINKKYQSVPNTNTNYSHNFILQFLAENGLIFTLPFLIIYFLTLVYLFRHHRSFFYLSLASSLNAFLDPSWNNPGIFILTLYFLFSPLVTTSTKSKSSLYFLSFQTLVLLLFFLSKTISDFSYLRQQPSLSLKFDPFNLNSHLALIDQKDFSHLNTTLKFFPNEPLVYQKLINNLSLPAAEKYYYHLLNLVPQENLSLYLSLYDLYLSQQNYPQINKLTIKIDHQFLPQKLNYSETTRLISLLLQTARYHWLQNQPSSSLLYLQTAVKFNPENGPLQIQTANALWHNNQPQKAEEQLQNCQKYIYPANECRQYLLNHLITPFDQPW